MSFGIKSQLVYSTMKHKSQLMQSTLEHCLAENLKHKFAWKKNYHKITNTEKKTLLEIKAKIKY